MERGGRDEEKRREMQLREGKSKPCELDLKLARLRRCSVEGPTYVRSVLRGLLIHSSKICIRTARSVSKKGRNEQSSDCYRDQVCAASNSRFSTESKTLRYSPPFVFLSVRWTEMGGNGNDAHLQRKSSNKATVKPRKLDASPQLFLDRKSPEGGSQIFFHPTRCIISM